MIAYNSDANSITGTVSKDRNSSTITNTWTKLNKQFEDAGVTPSTYIMDNEASVELKVAMNHSQTKYQLVPPHNYRSNLAERATQTFKHHFKAGLVSVDPKFPASQ